MTLVQEYLKHKSLQELEEDHAVKARVVGHKASLNYKQIEAKDSDKLAQQCRGLIIAPKYGDIVLDKPMGETVILARPFDRFFNYGQEAAHEVDLFDPRTRVFEKLDGTLTIVYHDLKKREWHVATRSVPEADLPIDGFGTHTFRTLFEKSCYHTTGWEFDQFTNLLDSNLTYMFELTTPLNRIVVDYQDYKVTLLGVRANGSGMEFDPIMFSSHLGVPCAKTYNLNSIKAIVDYVSNCDPTQQEGVVVCDHKYRRVKIKNAGYLALNRVRDSVLSSPRGLVELLLLDKLDDALPLFNKEIVDKAEQLREGYRNLAKKYKEQWDECMLKANEEAPEGSGSREHRKAFALAVQASKAWLPPLMSQYTGRTTGLNDWIMSQQNDDGTWSNGFLDRLYGLIK